MAVEWKAKNLVYVPVPKVACTTLKHVFHLLDRGYEFWNDCDPIAYGIHATYSPTPEFRHNRLALYSSWRRLVVVRDPIERFLSAYVHRIVDCRDLLHISTKTLARESDVPVMPNIHQFIEHFDIYRAISPLVRHHFESQAYFTGPDLGAYTHVYKFDELNLLHRMLVAEYGSDFKMPRLQESSMRMSIDAISVRELSDLGSRYAGDYALLRSMYSIDILLRKSRSMLYDTSLDNRSIGLHQFIPPLDMTLTTPGHTVDDIAIYTEGSFGSVTIRRHATLTIATSESTPCIVSFEKISPQFLILGESYEVAIDADSAFPTMVTCFVRYSHGDAEPKYFGTTYMALESGHNKCNVLLDTEVPEAVSPGEVPRGPGLRLILLFQSALGFMINVKYFRISVAPP